MRIFVGIALPQQVRDHLASALEMVAPIDLGQPGYGSRGHRAQSNRSRSPWIPSVNWHVTLGFFGEKPDGILDQMSEDLSTAAREFSPFELNLAGAGIFRHDVCWVGVSDPGGHLGPLADRIRQGYATADQHAQHRFHVTVSRAGRHAELTDLMAALSVYRGPAWRVDQITVFRSDLREGVGGHSLYTPLVEIPLG